MKFLTLFLIAALSCAVTAQLDLASEADFDQDSVSTFVMENLNEEGEFEVESEDEDSNVLDNMVASIKNMAYKFLHPTEGDDVEHTGSLEGSSTAEATLSAKLDNKSVGDVNVKASSKDSLTGGVAVHGNERIAYASGEKNATATVKTPNGTVEVSREDRFNVRVRVIRLGGKKERKALRELYENEKQENQSVEESRDNRDRRDREHRFEHREGRDRRGQVERRDRFGRDRDFERFLEQNRGVRVHLVTLEGRAGQHLAVGKSSVSTRKSFNGEGKVISAKGRPTRIVGRFRGEKRTHAASGNKTVSAVASTRGSAVTVVRLA